MSSEDGDEPHTQLQPQLQTQLQPHIVEGLVENQRRELELRAGELTLRAQEDEHAFKHAEKMLEAQERDRASQRVFRLKSAKHRYWFIGGLVLVAVVFLVILAFMGKDQMAMEIFKAAAYLATGATGGFFYGKSRNHLPSPSKPKIDEEDDE